MRVIGLDFGLKRIGIATGNLRTGSSQALAVVSANHGMPQWPPIDHLIAQWLPCALVVGLPLHMDGSEGAMAAKARAFGASVGRRFGLRVAFVDERLSTVAAEEWLARGAVRGQSQARRRQQHRDSLAAEIIVRTYLAERRNGRHGATAATDEDEDNASARA